MWLVASLNSELLGIMLSSIVLWAARSISPKGPLPIHSGVSHFLCGWLAGVILRENEGLIVGKISRALVHGEKACRRGWAGKVTPRA